MTTITIPNRPAGTDDRSIEDILANFDAITTVVNGNLSDANFTNWAPLSFTPTIGAGTTPPVIGNSSLIGRYITFGKFCLFRVSIILGSTFTSVGCTGAYSFTGPPIFAANDGSIQIGSALLNCTAGSFFGTYDFAGGGHSSTNVATNLYVATSSADPRLVAVQVGGPGGSNPLVPGTQIAYQGLYQTV